MRTHKPIMGSDMETMGLIVTIVTAAVGATWMLTTKLSGIESAIRDHVLDDAKAFENLKGRVVQLESRRRMGKK